MENIPGRLVISNCVTPSEKVLEFLDSQLKPVMQSTQSYIKDSGDFIKKIKNISTKDSILVTADVVRLYHSISHEAELKALEKSLSNRTNKKVSIKDLGFKWLKLFLKTTISNLTVKLQSRFREK